MNRSISRTLCTVAAAAATTAVVAIAGPAQATPNQPTLYVDGNGNGNQACIGGSADIEGYNLPAKTKRAEVTEFSALLVIKKVKVTGGDFVATIDSIGERGSVPYHVYAYNKDGKLTFDRSVTIKWVRCDLIN